MVGRLTKKKSCPFEAGATKMIGKDVQLFQDVPVFDPRISQDTGRMTMGPLSFQDHRQSERLRVRPNMTFHVAGCWLQSCGRTYGFLYGSTIKLQHYIVYGSIVICRCMHPKKKKTLMLLGCAVKVPHMFFPRKPDQKD